MPSSYTSLLGFVQPVTGELTNTWGSTVNSQLTQLVEDAIAQYSTASVTSGDWTLTTTAAGAQNQARTAILIATGAPGTTRYIYAPQLSKTYVVINAATGGSVTVKASGQTGVTVAVGEKAYVAFSDTDYVKIAGSDVDGVSTISFGTTGLTPSTATSGAVTVAGTLATTNVGTGLTSFTSGGAVYASSTSLS